MSVKMLLIAIQEAEERCRKYDRAASLLYKLTLSLYIPAFAVTVAGLVAYLLYGWWQIAAAGVALWIAGYAAYILHDVYSYRAVKAARQLCVLRTAIEAILEAERIKKEDEQAKNEEGPEA